MSTEFNQEKTIISSEVPKELEVNQSYARPEWTTEKVRYWIERGRHGYRGHKAVLAPSVKGAKWCYHYIDDKMPTKRLQASIKRVEAVFNYCEWGKR